VKKIIRKYSLLYLVLISVFFAVNFLGTNSFRSIFIDGDGSGHYAYLPSLLIYQSIDFEEVYDFEKLNKSPDYMGHNYHKQGNIVINKIFCWNSSSTIAVFLNLGYFLA